MRRTVDEIATELSIERASADGLVRFLFELGLAKFKGERPSARGRGPSVYEIESGAGQRVAEMIKGIEE